MGNHGALVKHQNPIPTPTVQDGRNNAGPSQFERNTPPLNTWAVQNPWPTPRHEGFDAGAHRGNPDSLHSAVKAWPTPRTAEAEHPGRATINHSGQTGLAEAVGTGKLHGRWTLALMGFDPDWCDDLPPDPLTPNG
jgi:hypothetical protein